MSSAQEAEIEVRFIKGGELVPSMHALEEVGHPQSPVFIQFDNKVSTALMNDEYNPKH